MSQNESKVWHALNYDKLRKSPPKTFQQTQRQLNYHKNGKFQVFYCIDFY